jgi:hypothetical protein
MSTTRRKIPANPKATRPNTDIDYCPPFRH